MALAVSRPVRLAAGGGKGGGREAFKPLSSLSLAWEKLLAALSADSGPAPFSWTQFQAFKSLDWIHESWKRGWESWSFYGSVLSDPYHP